MAALRTTITALLVMTAILSAQAWMTDYRGSSSFTCPDNQYLSFVESAYDRHQADRAWNFGCRALPSYTERSECSWIDSCPDGKHVAGISSFYNANDLVRVFSYKCCKAGAYTMDNCRMTGYINQILQPLRYDIPVGKYIKRMQRFSYLFTRDLLYKFELCDLVCACAPRQPGSG